MSTNHAVVVIPELSTVVDDLSPPLKTLVNDAKSLYHRQFSVVVDDDDKAWVAVAPGRVNLIGEHTDYTGGFVLPLAIDYCTVVYGSGTLTTTTTTNTTSSTSSSSATIRFVSSMDPNAVVQEETIDTTSQPLNVKDPKARLWNCYVVGVLAQYLPDLPDNTMLDVSLAIAGNVPLGSGLSSSASLEVAVATFLECILGDFAFSSSSSSSTDNVSSAAKTRALRCQKAENDWCHSPCGIMDQYVSSAASEGALLLIDCTSYDYTKIIMAKPNASSSLSSSLPALVVANSNVKHDIGGGEYPIRVQQCASATKALQVLDDQIKTLRNATLDLVEQAKDTMTEIDYRRAKHVVTENARTLQAKDALEAGDWVRVGHLMNASHASMRDDYEVSCEEIDVLVDLAQNFEGVYGSRLTGGGFGGCTVTLVDKDKAQALMDHLKTEYKAKFGLECICFETTPGPGAHILAVDTIV